jgi:hypothetical protein
MTRGTLIWRQSPSNRGQHNSVIFSMVKRHWESDSIWNSAQFSVICTILVKEKALHNSLTELSGQWSFTSVCWKSLAVPFSERTFWFQFHKFHIFSLTDTQSFKFQRFTQRKPFHSIIPPASNAVPKDLNFSRRLLGQQTLSHGVLTRHVSPSILCQKRLHWLTGEPDAKR